MEALSLYICCKKKELLSRDSVREAERNALSRHHLWQLWEMPSALAAGCVAYCSFAAPVANCLQCLVFLRTLCRGCKNSKNAQAFSKNAGLCAGAYRVDTDVCGTDFHQGANVFLKFLS